MVFGFYILELFLLFFMIVYFYKKSSELNTGKGIFKGILLGSYILQLLYLAVYISLSSGNHVILFGKLYYFGLLLLFSGYSFYYLSFVIKKEDRYVKCIGFGLLLFDILAGFLIVNSPIRVLGEYKLSFYNHGFSMMIGVLLFFDYILLLGFRSRYKKEEYVHLHVVFLVMLVGYLIQYFYSELGIFHLTTIFISFYLFITIENPLFILNERLKVEVDYAKGSRIDKSSFLKGISHEIRTPINTIDGFSRIIMDSDNIDEIREDVRDIREASIELIDIINGMIDLSIIESGELKVIYENYNVYEMFDNIVAIANSKIKDNHQKLEVKIDKKLPSVLNGDSERISQIVLNLIMNSIKFTDKGTITLKVDSVQSNNICRLKISVIDTGRGMDEEEISHLFLAEGNTLGLRVCKYLVDLMKGKIEVESTPGVGSLFVVTIDQKISEVQEAEIVYKKKKLIPRSYLGKRVLVVDDNKLNLKVASKLLSLYKVEVVLVNSGQECLDLIDGDTNFDLILMDDLMPNMSGMEAMDILKKIERVDGFYIPVVVVTANAISGEKERYIEAGFDDYLAKPINKYELDRVLTKFLQEGRK